VPADAQRLCFFRRGSRIPTRASSIKKCRPSAAEILSPTHFDVRKVVIAIPRAVGQSQRSAGAASFLGYFEREARMIFSTLSGGIVRGFSKICEASRFRSAILADLETRGLAISFVTLARTAVSISFFRFLRPMHQSWHRNRSQSVPFRTLPQYCAQKIRQFHLRARRSASWRVLPSG
jgi:hypothetical protein